LSIAARRRRPALVALTLSLFLTLPVIEAAPALAAPADRTQAATAPPNNALEVLSNLLARLLPTPPAAPAVSPGLVSTVTASTVRVNGTACGVRLAGSGFSAAPDTVVTNAHVVAGTATTSVLRPDGRTLPAQVQVFDSQRDLAVLSVPGLGEPALPVGSATTGETDVIFGHPRGQAPVRALPAVVARRVTGDIGDIYDRPAGPHQFLVLAASLVPGDSGAPMVNHAGQVVGVAFASSTLRPGTGFAVASEELTPVLAQPRSGAVSTGPCLAD
jgi:S1-C subfamily serine protease